jgi:hypothetical protein
VYAVEVTPLDASKTLKAGSRSPQSQQQVFSVIGQFEVSASLRFNEVLQRIETLTHLNLDDYDVVYRKRLYGHPWNSSLPIESERAHDAFVAEALRVKADAPIMVRLLRRHHGQYGPDHYYGPQTPHQGQYQQPTAYTGPQQSSSSNKSSNRDRSHKYYKHKQPPNASSPSAPSSVELVVLIRIIRGREVQRLNSPGSKGITDERHAVSGQQRTTRAIFETTPAAAADKVTRFSIKASHAFTVLREQMTAEVRRLLNDRQLKLNDFQITFSPSEEFNNFDKSIVIDNQNKYRSFVDEVLKKSRWGRPLIEVQLRWKGVDWVPTPLAPSRAYTDLSEMQKWGISPSKDKSKLDAEPAPRGRLSSMSPTEDREGLRSVTSTPRIHPDREGSTNLFARKRCAEEETSQSRDPRLAKRRRRSSITSPCAAREESSTTGSSPLEEGEHSEADNAGADSLNGITVPDGPYISVSEFMQNHRPGYDELVEKLHKQGIRDMPHLAACHTTGLLKGQRQRKGKGEAEALSLIDCVCIATWLRLWREMEPKAKKEAQDF